jgi:hypothetical protein
VRSVPRPKFRIGDLVVVSGVIHFYYDQFNNRQYQVEKQHFEAQIVGARRKFLGKYKPSSGGYNPICEDWENEPAFLEVKGFIPVWLVRRGLLNKEIEVREEDLELVARADWGIWLVEKTWKKMTSSWRTDDREDLRQVMENVPRDSKGRWLKEPLNKGQ